MRILLADESKASRLINRSTLEGLRLDPLEILEASGGEEALELLRNERLEIDLVLYDADGGGLDGVGFLKQLRGAAPFHEAAVILMTAQTSREKVAEALRWGARDYLVKPFTSGVLLQKIQGVKSALDARQMEDTAVLLRDMVAAAQAEKKLPFLRQLPDGLTQYLLKVGTRKTWPLGAVIFEAGRPIEALHILVAGEVELCGPGRKPMRAREGDGLDPRAFMAGEPATLTAVAASVVQGMLLDRLAIGEALRRHPRLGHYLRGLLSEKAAEGDASPLTGTLRDFPIVDVVQVLSMTQKSGLLNLRKRQQVAGIALERGEVRHAWLDEQEGEEAFYRLLRWDDATFSFDSGRAPQKVTVTTPTLTLLMEGARRKDETKYVEGPPKA
jgi:two-component system, chemotaxis family, chemotaxis protein CheY